MNPFATKFDGYFKYEAPERVTYMATSDISRYDLLIDGDDTTCDYSTFAERWREITHNMLEKSPNPDYDGKFPWDSCVVAGGSIARIIKRQFTNGNNFDIDIFVMGKDRNERVNNMRRIIQWFSSSDTYFSILGSVVGVYIIGCPRMFQIISNDKTNVHSVISTFDSSHLQLAVTGLTDNGDPIVNASAGAIASLKHMTTTPTNMGRFKAERFIKAMYDGYSVTYTAAHLDNELFDMSHLIVDPKNNQALKNTIAGFYKYWYPRDDPILKGEERDMYIKQEIKLHTYCNVVARGATEVLKHVTVGGNFETDYAATNYRSFNFTNVKSRGVNRKSEFMVHDHHGVVRLVTDIMLVEEIKQGADNMQIICNVEAGSEFEDFLKSIDTLLYRMYIMRAAVAVTLNENKVTFNVSNSAIDRQTANEVSILKNQHGNPTDIKTDLAAGDQIRILFSMRICIRAGYANNTNPGVYLDASRIMKYDIKLEDDDEETGNNSDISDISDVSGDDCNDNDISDVSDDCNDNNSNGNCTSDDDCNDTPL